MRANATGADAIAGFFTSANGTGFSGVTANKDKYGAYVANDAASDGSGAALRVAGKQNDGVIVSTDGPDSFGIRATASDTAISGIASGIGVEAKSTSATGITAGLSASAVSPDGKGVYGYAAAASGSTTGVFGDTASSSGYGLFGNASSVSGASYGVYGRSYAASGTGVYGQALGNGTTYGVVGTALSASGYGVYSNGRLHVQGNANVTGTMTKGAGTFRIDHPLDPANKFLSHSFVESPDMKNVYDGLVTLDGRGEATVELPGYYEALNRDHRYQLTPIGAPTVLYVKTEIAAGRFSIAGGEAGQKVSWQVTGIRQDRYAQEYPIVVEEAKTGADKGRYLHPELFGKPASRGLDRLPKGPAAPKATSR
jgi:hypothetical protein